ncbi:unnamed protein product [Amoebophrya sp. A25]|nr:unnamed protein product [Amoebophrya sp. A25]|eukprot:GSA25T00027982001.1
MISGSLFLRLLAVQKSSDFAFITAMKLATLSKPNQDNGDKAEEGEEIGT